MSKRMEAGAVAYFEGQYVPTEQAQVSIMTHAFNYGTGLFEGIRSAARGRTALVISQRVTSVRWCDRIAVLEDGLVSEAVGMFEQALSLDPEYSFGWLGMAECSYYAGDRKRALKLYLRTITENADNHRAWIRGCDLMREMGFGDNADSWWRKVVENFPEHPQVASSHKMADTEASDSSTDSRSGLPSPYATV